MSKGSKYAHVGSTLEPKETRIQLLNQALSASTQKQYKARISVFHDFITEMINNDNIGYEDATPLGSIDIFAHFLSHMGKSLGTYNRSTAEGYRCAILHYQRTWDLPPWAASKTCQSLVEGYSFRGKPQERSFIRAQVTLPMHRDMVEYCITQRPQYTDAIQLAFRVALRPHELMSLKKGSFSEDTLRIPDKRATSKNSMPPTTTKKVFDTYALSILSKLESSTAANTPYFSFTIVHLRIMWRKMITDLGLDSLPGPLQLDGPHCLRHGGMAYLLSEGISPQDLQVSIPTLRHYTRPNQKRVREELSPQ